MYIYVCVHAYGYVCVFRCIAFHLLYSFSVDLYVKYVCLRATLLERCIMVYGKFNSIQYC